MDAIGAILLSLFFLGLISEPWWWGPALARFCLARGRAAAEKGHYRQALVWCNRALAWKVLPEVCNYRGTIFMNLGLYSRAIADFDRAVALDPHYARPYNNRASAHNCLQQFDQAIVDLDRAITLDPEYAQAYNNRGVSFLGKGDYERALDDFDRAIEIDPALARAYYNRGYTFFSRDNYAFAIDDLSRAIAINPHYARAYFDRALSYFHGREPRRAREDLHTALQLGLDSSHAEMARDLLLKLSFPSESPPFTAA